MINYLNLLRNTRDRRRSEPQPEKAAGQIQMWAILQQGYSANYGPLPVCVNKVLSEQTCLLYLLSMAVFALQGQS